jgi:hypothetical protein
MYHNGARCTDMMRFNLAIRPVYRFPPLFLTIGTLIALSKVPYPVRQEQAL